MDSEQVQDWIMAGNAAAMDWFALTHDQPLPSQSLLERTLGSDLGSLAPGFGITARGGLTGSQLVVGGLIVIGLAWFLFRK
jgi:hypothetical protein